MAEERVHTSLAAGYAQIGVDKGLQVYSSERLASWSAYLLLVQSFVLLLLQNDSGLKLNLFMQTTALVFFALFCKATAGTYLSAPMVFASSIFIWHSTFLVGHYFEVAPIFAFDLGAFEIGFEYIYKATALVGLSLSLTIIGMMWGYRGERMEVRSRSARSAFTRTCYSSFDPTSKRISWYIFWGMVSIFGLFLTREGRNVFAGKYIDLYADPSASLSALLFFRTELFWPFVIVLLIACNKDSRRARNLVGVLVVIISVLLAMLGARSAPFVCLTALLLSWDSFVERVRLRWIAGFVLFLSAASYVIASGRSTGLGAHVFEFSDTGKESLQLLSLFHEQGRSIEVVLRTISFSQQGGLMFGRSFVDAAVAIIPLPILKFTGYRFAESTGDWIVDNSPDIPLNEGAGSSLIAELYHNFGMLGSLGFLLIGWYISRAYFKYAFTGDIFTGVKVMSVVGVYVVMMRNEVGSVFRLLLYAFVIVALLRRRRKASFIGLDPGCSKNVLGTQSIQTSPYRA